MKRKPRIFIASSAEALSIAEALNVNLERHAETQIWTTPKPSTNFIDSLIALSKTVDYGIFVFAPDDTTTSRGEVRGATRDNVIFELGLFMGALGKERCFIVLPRNTPPHIPTDLLGYTPLQFDSDRTDADMFAATRGVATIISTHIERRGSLAHSVPLSPEHEASPSLVDSFPRIGQKIHPSEIKNIFLKFNKPIDRESALYIGNFYFRKNTFMQWNIGGWIQFEESDTKLIWHIHDHVLSNEESHRPTTIDYPNFEIHIGRPPEEWRLKDTDGNYVPRTIIPVQIE